MFEEKTEIPEINGCPKGCVTEQNFPGLSILTCTASGAWCPACGQKISKFKLKPRKIWCCHTCGNQVGKDWNYCMGCGEKR